MGWSRKGGRDGEAIPSLSPVTRLLFLDEARIKCGGGPPPGRIGKGGREPGGPLRNPGLKGDLGGGPPGKRGLRGPPGGIIPGLCIRRKGGKEGGVALL